MANITAVVIPATTRADARANSKAGPKGERQDGASKAETQRLCFCCKRMRPPFGFGKRITFGAELPLAFRERITFKAELPLAFRERIAFKAEFPLAFRERITFKAEFPLAFRERVTLSQGFRAATPHGSLFFACTKKSNQKKCTPGIALFGLLPEKYAASACVPPIARPCASGGIGAIHRAAPAGIAAAAAAMQWGPNGSALLRAEAKSEKRKTRRERRKGKAKGKGERRATV